MKRAPPCTILIFGMACADDDPSAGSLTLNETVLDPQSALWLSTEAVADGWGRAVLIISDETRDCSDLPKQAPGLRSLYRSSPIQGEGTGLLIWLQWIDQDSQMNSWEGRFVFGEAPVGDRQQRRAVQIPFEYGVPTLSQTGRHGSMEVHSIETHEISGEINSDRATGTFRAQRCGT